VELVNDMVATPRLVKMDEGRLPVAVFIPMTTGNGPFPLGVVIVELKVIEAEPWVTTTESRLLENVAVTLLGGAPLGPETQCCICALISARLHLHWSRLLMRVPLVIKNGSGKFATAGSALNAGGAGGAGQSAPVFSLS
jgi:hypothetical protein